jgi:DNA-binding phage protein
MSAPELPMPGYAASPAAKCRVSIPVARAVDFWINAFRLSLMNKSTTTLKNLLERLTVAARKMGLNDSAWASAAGLSKETLSRLRRRSSCDLSTLIALADAAGASLSVTAVPLSATTADGHFPSALSRDYERRLLMLCASRNLDPAAWAAAGPAFFMAGLAVMLASNADADRRGLLALAEALHPGATEVPVFARWLNLSPLRPSRFLPMLRVETKHAA